jgi:hypothetical protein
MDPCDPPDEFGDDEPRIEEIQLGKDSLISINIALYVSEEQEYAGRRDIDIDEATNEELARAVVDERFTIGGVRDLSGELIDSFPYEESLTVQAALWQRAVVGLHLFRDGNHRTGLRSLRDILEMNDIELYKEPLGEKLRKRNEKAIELSRGTRLREKFTEGKTYTGNEMYQKDELFGVWLSYFSEVL